MAKQVKPSNVMDIIVYMLVSYLLVLILYKKSGKLKKPRAETYSRERSEVMNLYNLLKSCQISSHMGMLVPQFAAELMEYSLAARALIDRVGRVFRSLNIGC